MWRAQLEVELRCAEERIAQGEQHLARQAALVAKLERLGLADETAAKTLDALRRSQALFVEERDRLRRTLESLGPAAS